MRGLKHRDAAVFKLQQESHLLQMRGLKHQYNQLYKYGEEVASFTDAWIETVELMDVKREDDGRIFYRCVDWNIFIGLGYARPLVASFTDAWIETRCCLCEDSCRESHLLQMRGLKLTFAVENSIWKVASFTDAWIETVRMRLYITLIFGRIFYRCVDWNCDEESIVMGIMCRIFYRCVDWNKAS